MTDRPFRILRDLRESGQAWGGRLMWLGLAAFAAASPISIAATNMAWVVALVGFLLCALQREARAESLVRRTELDAPLLCFAAASLVSVFLSLDIWASVVEFRSLGLMVIFFLFAWQVRTGARRRVLFRILFAFSCLSALYGWVQFLTDWDLLGHYRPESGKVCGTFGLHLTYGEYLSMVICTATGVLLQREGTRLARWMGVLLLGLLATAMILSGSKGALLGLLVGLGVVFSLHGRRVLGLYVLTGILSLLALDLLTSHQLLGNLAALFRAEAGERFGPAASNAHRLCMWWTGLWISLEHFVSGVGLHALERIYPAFRHPLAIEPNQWHLHNNFVHLGVTRGMLGLAAFLFLFLVVFRLGLRLRTQRGPGFDRGLVAGVLGAASAFLVAGLTEYNWGDSEVLMLLYMLLGLLASCESPALRTAGAAVHPPASDTGEPRAAPQGLLRAVRPMVFASFAAGLCGLAFVGTPGPRFPRMSLWEGILGASFLVFSVWGWNRGGQVPVWQRQACGGLAVCVGYRFTQGVWTGEAWVGAGPWHAWAGGAGFLAVSSLCLLLFRGLRGPGDPARPVDVAGIGSLWLWSAIALGTHGLLRLAGWREPLLGPPYLPLLLLGALSALVYAGFRFTYSGGRAERLLLAALGLCSLFHVFR